MRNYISIVSFFIFISGHFCLKAEDFTLISIENFELVKRLKFQNRFGPQSLYITKSYLNVPHPIPEGQLIHFYAVNPKTDLMSQIPLLRIEFETRNDTIVLLKSNERNPNEISHEFLDNTEEKFPFTSVLIYNLSKKNVVGVFTDNLVKIPSNEKKLVTLPKNQKGTFNGKVSFYARENDNEIYRVKSSSWRIKAKNKVLLVITDCFESNELKFQKFVL
jgi:hypothetical protein